MSERSEAAAAVPRARKTFGIVWLVPVVALALAAWVAWTTWSSRGPSIVVTFQTASGLTAGQTKLRYRDVDIGQVEWVRIGDHLKTVRVGILVNADAAHLINDQSRFWVVRPRFGAGQVSGLETLVSGAYIEVDPGAGASTATEFTGLENPPRVRSDTPGRSFTLRAPNLGSLSVGTPVLFRGITVGELTDFEPPTGSGDLIVHLFIRQPYGDLVRKSSRFWRSRAVDFDVSAEGVRFSIGNIETLLLGGVMFDSPEGEMAAEGEAFNLFDDIDELSEAMITERIPVISYFDGSVRGLSPGAPVEFRGMRIGTVKEISLEFDVAAQSVRIPVVYEIEPQRIRIVNGTPTGDGNQVSRLVEQGMRARLATGNLLTGQMLISLEILPDAPPEKIGNDDGKLIMPTAPSSLDTLERSLTGILDKVASLPIADLVEELRKTAEGIAKVAGSGQLEQSMGNLNKALDGVARLTATLEGASGPLVSELERTTRALGDAARSADGILGPRSSTQQDLNRLMRELTATARSVRDLADYLERHPEALLRGKTGGRN
ncbi:MAG TPA: MlaD family protein [Geminicoccus sp.]|jgi:paraquat-inducible protein B|uniref:PqiB family protein n=1 Tax=Geminicoccus sp. TaxID=2024832 RepID=UPI002E2F33D2|nr:MlaD family protein [Geminicoccus sp.]HEX2528386.1 MlaD family protein [Geminicoccus sp.]